MVNGTIKTISGMFLLTKSLQLGFWRLWQHSSDLAKIQSKCSLLATKNKLLIE